MGKKLNQLLIIIFLCGLTWAALSDWAISYWGKYRPQEQVEMVRAVNDVAWFGVVLLVLYRQIRRQQRSLSTSESQYRTLFAANPNPMWIYDPATMRFEMVNQAAIATYGYSADQFKRLTIFDIRPPADHQRLIDVLGTHSETVHKTGIWQHIKADGSELTVSVTSHPLTFNGKACKMVMVTDVTELMEKKAHLKASSEALLRVSWSHSHELRKPLCSILAMLPLLEDTQSAAEREHLLALLKTCALELDDSLQRNTAAITKLSNQFEEQ
ncbi:MAG: PAS domain S-box protein [Bacteroidota bacterium]